MSEFSSRFNTEKLVIDMDNFTQPHRIIMWRQLAVPVLMISYDEYLKKIDSIAYEISEEMFYYP